MQWPSLLLIKLCVLKTILILVKPSKLFFSIFLIHLSHHITLNYIFIILMCPFKWCMNDYTLFNMKISLLTVKFNTFVFIVIIFCVKLCVLWYLDLMFPICLALFYFLFSPFLINACCLLYNLISLFHQFWSCVWSFYFFTGYPWYFIMHI